MEGLYIIFLFFRSFNGHVTEIEPIKSVLWSDGAIFAFKVLVCRLISAPVLVLPDTRFGATFTIATNASNVGIAGVLLQDQGFGLGL